MANLEEVAKCMSVMSLAYPRYEMQEATVKVYAGLLQDIPFDALEAGAKQIMAESTFFPSVAEWRQKCMELMSGIQNTPSAFEAWENAMAVVRKYGDYYNYTNFGDYPEYSHPLVERAVKTIGYRRLVESDNIVADRAHFFKIYESLLNRARDDMNLLPGSREISERYALGVGSVLKKLAMPQQEDK